MSIALISCSNGLGHIKRLIILQQELNKLNLKSTIFGKSDDIFKIKKAYNLKNISYVNFDSQTKIDNFIMGNAYDFKDNLLNLSSFKIIISDNLLELLSIRKDTIIMGSFLWHKTLKDINIKIKNKHNYLLKKYKPKIICNYLLSQNYIKNYKNKIEVGFFSTTKKSFKNKKKTRIKKNLLLSIGKGHQFREIYVNFLNNFIENKFHLSFKNIYLDPTLYRTNLPNNFQIAKYNNKMYQCIDYAIIRPGMGTISDLINLNVKLAFIYEENNKEVSNNANMLIKLNRGVSINRDLENKKLIKFIKDIEKSKYNKKINLNGARETALIIKKLIKRY